MVFPELQPAKADTMSINKMTTANDKRFMYYDLGVNRFAPQIVIVLYSFGTLISVIFWIITTGELGKKDYSYPT